MSEPLRELGSFVAKEQDRSLEERAVVNEVVRRAIAAKSAARPRRRAFAALLLPLAAALALLVYLVTRHAPTPDANLPGASPSVLVASLEDQAHAFPDGTTVLLAAGGEAEVTSASQEGGRVELRHGRMRISVPPNRGSRWAFVAGDYVVEVTGTRFDLGWDPSSRAFDLEMLDGSVRVSGGDIEPRVVVAGQRLKLRGGEHATASAWPAALEATSNEPDQPTEPKDQPSALGPSATAAHSAAAERPSWQPLALEGKYAQAVKLAEESGFEAVLARSSASELLLLGDACRFAAETARASQAYQAVRKQHAGSLEARRAIFSLGVLAFPGKAAIPLFEQYLGEAPSGPLAPEALGRILEVRHRGGEGEAAKKLAAQYLAQYPKGAHARLAQSIIDDASP